MPTFEYKPSQVMSVVKSVIESNERRGKYTNLCIWGTPGIGKSEVMAQVAKSIGFKMEDIRAVTLDPVDLRGLPYADDSEEEEHKLSRWAVPYFLPRVGKYIVFLDELNRAPQLVQNACLQLVQERRLGEYVVPDNVHFVAACNPHSAGTHRMSDAMSDRWLHLDMVADLQEFLDWGMLNEVHDLVRAYQKFTGGAALSEYDAKERSYPTPRSWVALSNIVHSDMPEELKPGLYAGCVGEGRGGEFSAFEKLTKDLPTVDEIFMHPESAKLPKNPSAQYAVGAALGRAVTADTFGQALTYMKRLEIPEFEVLTVTDAVKRDRSVTDAPQYKKWADKNINLFV